VSLYGDRFEDLSPTPERLAAIDVLVVDLADVGSRYYTYVYTMSYCMEAAAAHGKEVIVLDRPNPITGRKVDGFVTDSAALFRFGSYARVPVVHGMTMGELARLYNGERMLRGARTVKLDVVPMLGWTRDMWYDQTGLDWRKPSPNLLTFESLLAYVGTCLFEAVNVSEGRGTDHPFQLLGAPWLDNDRAIALLRDVPLRGVAFEAVEFTPEQKPYHGRPPELTGERLHGIRVRITDRDAFEPYKTGVALLWAVHTLHRDRLVWNDATLDRLVATPRLKAMLAEGRTPADIFAAWEAEVAAFRAVREKYLLYR
ncbi:MAG: exo-beta-N-acetylmuramidase NamZ domain-containing protein, partial [Gemmatimonadota bacterium]